MDLWRGEAYTKFFEHLEATGGFYYEVSLRCFPCLCLLTMHTAQRWGDAPVHSIAAALFARKNQLHFFKDIGNLRSYLIRSQSNSSISKATSMLNSDIVPRANNGEKDTAHAIQMTVSVRIIQDDCFLSILRLSQTLQ